MKANSLISLKIILFLFFGSIGCLFPFLPLHMKSVGLTLLEARIISIVAPLLSLIGPLTVGPVIDKFNTSKRGQGLRTILAIFSLLSAMAYSLLMAVPTVQRIESQTPAVSFICDPHGGAVLQERCLEPECFTWPEKKIGPLFLTSCRYNCQPSHSSSRNSDYNEGSGEDDKSTESDVIAAEIVDSEVKSHDSIHSLRHTSSLNREPPHICVSYDGNRRACHVYTGFGESLRINVTLEQATNSEADKLEWCYYPIADEISCNIPADLVAPLGHKHCRIECELVNPYQTPGSILAQSLCKKAVGDPIITFWSYLLVRSIGDVFLMAAVCLIDTLILVATRETEAGKADVGRQFVFGSLGFGIFAPFTGYLYLLIGPERPAYLIMFISYVFLMILSALILTCTRSIPLNPSDWWWNSRGGLIPFGTLRKWKAETSALLFVLLLLGVFASALDSYLPWHLVELHGSEGLIGLTITVGILPALPLLWYSEHVIDYCGYSNLLITAFAIYIIRFTGLSSLTDPWWILLFEALEVFTLSLMWIAALLYLRHLMPRCFLATGQALAVAAHFCIGRSLGALFASCTGHFSLLDSAYLVPVYQIAAIAAAVIASVYFIVYHCCLKPLCMAPVSNRQSQSNRDQTTGAVTNGTYTPLRVYQKDQSQKDQSRY